MTDKIISAITSDVEASKSNPLKAADNIAHSSVDATVVNATNGIADVLDPAYKSVKNVFNIVNPNSYKRNGVKNIIKAPAAAITQGATALTNIPLGIVSAVRNLYKKGVQDNARHIENATIENIPGLGSYLSKLINAGLAIPAMIPATLDGLGKVIDSGKNKLNEFTLLEGQEVAVNRMRV